MTTNVEFLLEKGRMYAKIQLMSEELVAANTFLKYTVNDKKEITFYKQVIRIIETLKNFAIRRGEKRWMVYSINEWRPDTNSWMPEFILHVQGEAVDLYNYLSSKYPERHYSVIDAATGEVICHTPELGK